MTDICLHYQSVHEKYGRFFFDLIGETAITYNSGVYVVGAHGWDWSNQYKSINFIDSLDQLPDKPKVFFENRQALKKHGIKPYGLIAKNSILIFGGDMPGSEFIRDNIAEQWQSIDTPVNNKLWSVVAAAIALSR